MATTATTAFRRNRVGVVPSSGSYELCYPPPAGDDELADMPNAATAPARPATDVRFAVDLDAIAVPEAP